MDTVSSTVLIGLPFTIQSHIDAKYNIACMDDTSRVLYVYLQSIFDEYASVNYTTALLNSLIKFS